MPDRPPRGRRRAAGQAAGQRPRGSEELELRLLYIQALRDGARPSAPSRRWRCCSPGTAGAPAAFPPWGSSTTASRNTPWPSRRCGGRPSWIRSNAEVWNNLGLVALARGRDREAFAAFDKAADLDPASLAPLLNKAAVLLDCGDYKRARDELERAARQHPDDAELQVALGVAYRGLKEHDRARLAYERALQLRPQYPAALFNLGVLYMDFLSDKARAREHLTLYQKVTAASDARSKEVFARLRELK